MKLQQLGRYQLMDRIAFGGMAEIYRARFIDDAGQEQIAAVKKVLGHLSEDDDFIQMLIDEARISSLLNHPNIAKVYEFGREEQHYFIAMEFVDGKDLRTILESRRAEGRPLPIQHSLYTTIAVLRGLHEAHTKKADDGLPLRIIHRDISPSNVLITYPGEVKLIDFGIAKAVMNRVRTQTGVIKGKVKYMSPEQAMGQELDARSDLFSVGTLLYEMLTNQPPFLAVSELDLIFKVRDANVAPPSRQNPAVDQALDAIILKAMARTRQSRFQSGEEFAQTLEDYLYQHFPKHHPRELSELLQKTFAQQILEERRLFEEELKQAKNAPGAIHAAVKSSPAIAKSGAYPPTPKTPSSHAALLRSNSQDQNRQSLNGVLTPPQPTSTEAPRFSSANPVLRQSLSGALNPLRPSSLSDAPRASTPAKDSVSSNQGGARLGSGANPSLSSLPTPSRPKRATTTKIPVFGDIPIEEGNQHATFISSPILDDDAEINAETDNRPSRNFSLQHKDDSEAFDTVRMEPLFNPDDDSADESSSQPSLEVLLQNIDFSDDPGEEGKPTRILYKQETAESKQRTEKKTILARPLRDLLPSPKKPAGDSQK
jgi:eukaryotic-like serine/threonine-protein kinase